VDLRRLFRTYLWPQKRTLILLMAMLLFGLAFELAGPQLLQRFIDQAGSHGAAAGLATVALLYLATAAGLQVTTVVDAYLAHMLAMRATNQLRVDLLVHCLRLDPPFHAAHPPGVMVERVDGDVAQLYELCARFGVRIIGSALLLIGVLTLYARVDSRVGLVMVVFTAISAAVLYRMRHVALRYWGPARQASAELYGFLEEHLSGTEDLRSSGATGYAVGRLNQRTQALLHTERRARAVGAVTYNIGVIMLAIGSALAIGLGIWLMQRGEATIGTIYLLFAYTELLQRPIDTITREVEVLQRATASLARIRELLATTSAIADGPGAALPDDGLGVAFERVSFAYRDDRPGTMDDGVLTRDEGRRTNALEAEAVLDPGPGMVDDGVLTKDEGRRTNGAKSEEDDGQWTVDDSPLHADPDINTHAPVDAASPDNKLLSGVSQPPGHLVTRSSPVALDDITFALAPGEVLGLLGRTGSGKTTITRLLLRLFDPASGSVMLGGVDLRTLRLEQLRQHVAIVTQDIQLFEGSLRDNLTLFDQTISDERLEAALTEVGLEGWLRGLPEGLGTQLAADGGGLSAGEGQLLAFARVFLRDPAVIILDEASARLDPATERAMEQAITRLLRPEGRRRTAIIIAHRLKTIQRADRILILEGGRIVEYSKREALAQDPDSRFSQLLRVGMEEALA
jgi:ABC-type multidrug transport system fused ATPase/permease subunit